MHGEGGVRSGDLSSPWPEEGYRAMISRIATHHAVTTEHNLRNLQREGLQGESIRVTGSPVVESVRERMSRHGPLGGPHEQVRVLLTLHRRENRGHFGDIFAGIAAAFQLLPGPDSNVNTLRDPHIEWPTHPNGWAMDEAPEWAFRCSKPPFPADLLAGHLANADLVITDSGGLQEESCVAGVPCCVARTVTDRPESLYTEPGGNCVLGGNTSAGITQAIQTALGLDRTKFRKDIYGDGTASKQISEWLQSIVATTALEGRISSSPNC
jgi:UDP-N-acetylglucosamine 2-epimerase (non-hydrolysing)